MNFKITGKNNNIAVIQGSKVIISDAQSALDLAMEINYDTGINHLVIPKECITEDFFVLSTRIAGEILQKYVNYGIRLAIVGDFSCYTSKPLHDFIYESNAGYHVCFVPNEHDAIKKLESYVERRARGC